MTQNSIEQQAWFQLLECQRRVLERVANRASLAEIFETLVKLIEDQARDMRCAVLLADSAGQRLHFVAAPNIPEDYKRDMEPFLRIAPDVGACGTATFRREPVYTRDTRSDPLWKDCGHIEQYIKAPMSVIHPDDTPRVLEKWRAAMAAEEPYEDEMRLRRTDGQYRWFLIRTVPFRDEQGNIVKWYGTSTDIEERKQAEDTLRRNQAFFAAEAQRVGGLLQMAALGHGNERSEGGEVAATTRRGVTGKSLPGEVVAERTIPQNQRIIAERQAIESLTANERSIIRLITAGKSNVEVAESMHLSPRTVETYRSRLMEKLQLEDLVALVKFAIRNGMSSVD